MAAMTDLPFSLPEPDPTAIERPPKVCRRHDWFTTVVDVNGEIIDIADPGPMPHRALEVCRRCNRPRDALRSRRNRLNWRRGNYDELTVARMLGGRKVGQLGLPWDCEVPGYLRVQAKKTATWPSLAKVIEWLDTIPVGPEMRAVTLADTPGPGGRTRRLILLDLGEFCERHGGTG